MTEPNEFQPLLDWIEKYCEEAVDSGLLHLVPDSSLMEEMNGDKVSDS